MFICRRQRRELVYDGWKRLWWSVRSHVPKEITCPELLTAGHFGARPTTRVQSSYQIHLQYCWMHVLQTEASFTHATQRKHREQFEKCPRSYPRDANNFQTTMISHLAPFDYEQVVQRNQACDVGLCAHGVI